MTYVFVTVMLMARPTKPGLFHARFTWIARLGYFLAP
jgi:hypothetical protein